MRFARLVSLGVIAGLGAALLGACDGGNPSARLPTPPAASSDAPVAELETWWVGDADADTPLVVLLHGYGAPGDDLAPVARELRASLGRPVRVALPQAPIALGPNARAWWRVDLGARPADRGQSAPTGLTTARRALVAWLEAERDEGRLDPERTVLAGFSQGAMLAADVALRGSFEVAGVAMLSGGPVDERGWTAALATSAPPAVFMSHGRQDAMLSFGAAERLAGVFRAADVPVTFETFEGGHEIPREARGAWFAWLRERFGREP